MGQARISRRRLMLLVTVVVIGLVGGVVAVVTRGSDNKPEATASPSGGAVDPAVEREKKVAAGIDGVLKARAAAVMSNKLDQFLTLVDPGNKALRRSQSTLFANMRRLGLQSISYRRRVPYIPEAVGGGKYQMHVVAFVQIRGIDAAPRMTARLYTLAAQSGTWRLTADQPDEPGVEAWDLGPITVTRGPAVVVVAPAGEHRNAARLAEESAAALRGVQTILGRAPRGLLVVAVDNARTLAGAETGGHPAGAVAMPNYAPIDPADLTRARISGSRVVLNPSYRKQIDRYVLSHEFTHAAMMPLSGNPPLWLVEGLAEYTEYSLNRLNGYGRWVNRQRDKVRRESIPGLQVLPIDGVFHGEYGDDSYGVSWVITDYLVHRYGIRTVLALYEDLAKSDDAPETREQLLRKHLRLGETGLVAAVRRG